MLIPIKCFNCGKVLANKYGFYLRQVHEKKLELCKDPAKVMYFTSKTDAREKTVEGKVLDEMGLHSACCRQVMLCHVDII